MPRGQLLLCQGGLGPFTALVAASDLYVGYDSGFQHIAAALSVFGLVMLTTVSNGPETPPNDPYHFVRRQAGNL